MDTRTSSGYIVFFTLTGLDDLPYLTGLYDKDQNGSFGLVTGTFYSKEEAEIQKVFPEEWLSSCIAVNTESGKVCWLVDDNEDKLILLIMEDQGIPVISSSVLTSRSNPMGCEWADCSK